MLNGATKGQIRARFLPESILLAVLGGVGVLAGAAATAVYASSMSWAVVIPVEAWSGGIASAILIGAFAGLMPALTEPSATVFRQLYTATSTFFIALESSADWTSG